MKKTLALSAVFALSALGMACGESHNTGNTNAANGNRTTNVAVNANQMAANATNTAMNANAMAENKSNSNMTNANMMNSNMTNANKPMNANK